jgi:glycosyltransferase involved in cell wall biosynthesis
MTARLQTDSPHMTSAARPAPLISVLLPVYNGERYLATALQSILNQTYQDFELIAVNDGSTDRSQQILDEFASRDPRVRPITLPHVGLVRAFNAGLEVARGELIARMDGDDEALPERFDIQVRYMREHPEVVMVGSQVMQIDEDNDPLAPLPGLEIEHEKIDQSLLELGWPIVHPSVMIRAGALRAVGGYPDFFPHEDHDLFLRLAECGRLANVPQTLLRYRRHAGCVTAKLSRSEGLAVTVKKACERRGIPFSQPRSRYPRIEESPRRARHRAFSNWAWASLRSGNVRTARKYAHRALLADPINIQNLRLLACVYRGR